MSRIERLWEALRQGDAAALEACLPELRARLRRLAERRLGEDRAEEAVQETLLTLWKKRAALRDADHLMPFVFQVLRNKIGNAYARAQRERGRTGAAEALEAVPDPSGPFASPAAAHEGLEVEELVERALPRCRAISPACAEVLELLWEGLSPDEIRRRLGEPRESTLLSRVHRARKLLRRVLQEDFGIDVTTGYGRGG